MERRRIGVDVSSLAIDESKEGYLATKGVLFADCLEVLNYRPHFFISQTARGERFAMLGPNHEGRYLLTAIAPFEGGTWRLISAYWLRQNRGRRLYEEGHDERTG